MFSDKVIKVKSINESGSDVFRRYEYQLACVFATFLTLYKKTENFYVLLDYLDDYVIVEEDKNNNELITFIQVKTKKDVPLTMKLVCNQRWLHKQATNQLNFIDEDVRNILQTNLGIKVNGHLVNSDLPISINDLKDDKDLEIIKSQITRETGIDDFSNFFVLRSKLTLDDFDNQLRGLITKYINENKYSDLTEESIEAIYRKIWSDLSEKQRAVVDESEARSLNNLMDKKSLKYGMFKDVFKVMLDIQLPKPGAISSFVNEHKIFLEGMSEFDFGDLFREFRIESAQSGLTVVNECWYYLRENKDYVDSTNSYTISSSILSILDKNETINTSEFYKKFRICISILFTYKKYEY